VEAGVDLAQALIEQKDFWVGATLCSLLARGVTGRPSLKCPWLRETSWQRSFSNQLKARKPGLSWAFVEPPEGIEPSTYALRVRCSGRLS
jgi:putative NADH-flavin reductase